VVEAVIRARFVSELELAGAAVLTREESTRFLELAIDPQTHRLAPSVVGRDAATLAERAAIRRPYPIRLLVVPTTAVEAGNALATEKLAPVLSLFTVADADKALEVCRALLALDGRGHTAIIHAQDPVLVERFAAEMPASRILVNSPGTQGVLGLTTGLVPSMTLGCGTFGGTSTTDNVTYTHLLNIKRIAYYRPERASSADAGNGADEASTPAGAVPALG
jgi:acyl-CoA reductase-like NAD-dependent aldehyde dehydrogenase